MLERVERVEHAAELGQRDATAEPGQPLRQRLGRLQVGHGVGFAQFEGQRIARQARRLEHDAQPGQQAGVLDAGSRQVQEQPCAMTLGAVFGQQLDGVEDDPAIDLGGQARLAGDAEELAGRYLYALRVEQAQQHFVVFETVATQADDRLEQQAEAVVLQGLLEHGDDVAAVGGGGQLVGRVVDFQRIAVAQVIGAAVRALDGVLRLGGLFVEAGDTDAEGGLHRAAADV